MTQTASDADQIKRLIAAMFKPGQVFEIRALDATLQGDKLPYDKPRVISGYFDNANDAIVSVTRIASAAGIYITVNPVHPALLARANNSLKSKKVTATTDEQITARQWILLDCDPDRAGRVSGVPTNDDEHQTALTLVQEIRDALTRAGWPLPIEMDSGNGAYLAYAVDLPANDDGLVQRVLAGLAKRFDTEQVHIDLTTFNQARIMRLCGTMNCKGDGTEDRPHRLSRLLAIPDEIQPVSQALLEAVASPLEQPQEKKEQASKERPQGNDATGKSETWFEAFREKHGIEVVKSEPYRGGIKYLLATCPFCGNGDHNAIVTISKDDALNFSCSHNSCKGIHKWKDFRLHFEPDAYDKKKRGADGYKATASGMAYETKDGLELISNFTAEILTDITTDDGIEQVRTYEVEAVILNRRRTFEIPAKEFAACSWVDEHLGARAYITTGQSMKSHLVNAVKACSDPGEQYQYAHTGWRSVDGQMVFLHANGFISQVVKSASGNFWDLTNQAVSDKSASKAALDTDENVISQVSQVNREIRVKLEPGLKGYDYPALGGDLRTAIRASLQLLTLVKDTIGMPLYCSVWRSPLPYVNYGMHVVGASGLGKTEYVALMQQHDGASMDASHLPGSWSSTVNSLEKLMFQAKDAWLTIDDFKPIGSRTDQDQMHKKADNVFRSIGNGSARGRLTATLEQREQLRPRCLLVSTGEDAPRGQSLKARGVIVTMDECIVKGAKAQLLTQCQRDARNSLYAQAKAGYIQWLAPQMKNIEKNWHALLSNERDSLNIEGHGRSGTNTANMLIGMQYFLRYAVEVGAITPEESATYFARCKNALKRTAEEANQDNTSNKPSEQWLRLVVAAIDGKSAHLVDKKGDNPGDEYGWCKSVRSGFTASGEPIEDEIYRGGGTEIGWIDDDDIFLLPELAYKAACAIGHATGDHLTTLEPTLRKLLHQDGLIASTALQTPRNTITIRRSRLSKKEDGLQSRQYNVLHLKKETLYPTLPPSLPSKNLTNLTNDSDENASQADSRASQVDFQDLTSDSCENASQADSRASQVKSQKLDYPEAEDLTSPHTNGKYTASHIPDDAINREMAQTFLTQIEKSQSGPVIWKVQGSIYPSGEVSMKEFKRRVQSEMVAGGDGLYNVVTWLRSLARQEVSV